MDKKIKRTKPKNRFYKGSKYSEYKIEKVIKCFADDLTLQETADKTKISVRSLRPIFRTLRLRMFMAARRHNRLFGYAGMFLNIINRDDLERMMKGEKFQARMKKYFPRAPKPEKLSKEQEGSTDVVLLLMELIIRDCSQSEFVKDDDFDRRIIYLQKAAERSGLLSFIDQREENPDRDYNDYQSGDQKFDKMVGEMARLYEQQAETIGHIIRSEFEKLSENARTRLYSGEVIFRDLKKYVLKHPL